MKSRRQQDQPHLKSQDSPELDIDELTPLTPEVMSRQATINIGIIGHVAHGKSTMVKAISGVQTVRFKDELVRNITIKLGYANAKIYQCDNKACSRVSKFHSAGSEKEDNFPCDHPRCTGRFRLQRHVSFVDCPGHDVLMATMLSGAAIMDAAILVIAANEPCPQPQTSEHLAAVEIMKLSNIIMLQNKIDLVDQPRARDQYESIVKFVQGTVAEGAPIIPISAQLQINVDFLCEHICNTLPIPDRDLKSPPRLFIIRSFDINKPGSEVDHLKGGVVGGSLLRGVLQTGMDVEIRPGVIEKDENGRTICKPIFSTISSMHAEQNDLNYAVPGGLIGVGTTVDPMLTRADRMVGQVLGAVGTLPSIFVEVELIYYLLRRLLGVRASGKMKGVRVHKLDRGEVLTINIGSLSTQGKVIAIRADRAKVSLDHPVCCEIGEKIAISRRFEGHWRLIGWGVIRGGVEIEPVFDL